MESKKVDNTLYYVGNGKYKIKCDVKDIPKADKERQKDINDYYDGVEGTYSDLHNQYLQELEDKKKKQKN